MVSEYLNFAKNKFSQSKGVNFELSLRDFICDCYVRLNPCSYGVRIEKKIVLDFEFESVMSKTNRGDGKKNGKYFEIKVTFLSNVTNSYSLTHLRPWQLIDYYMFCLVDCDNDFTPMFFVIPKHMIHKFKLSPMNGTERSNENNHNIEMRSTIVNGSKEYKDLFRYNLLPDTSDNSLRNFFGNVK
jgi:hypothetical protein